MTSPMNDPFSLSPILCLLHVLKECFKRILNRHIRQESLKQAKPLRTLWEVAKSLKIMFRIIRTIFRKSASNFDFLGKLAILSKTFCLSFHIMIIIHVFCLLLELNIWFGTKLPTDRNQKITVYSSLSKHMYINHYFHGMLDL